MLVADTDRSASAWRRFFAKIASQTNANPKPMAKEIKLSIVMQKVEENRYRSFSGKAGKCQALPREKRQRVETVGSYR